MAYLSTGGQLGLGSRRACAPRVHFRDSSAMQRWKWSALKIILPSPNAVDFNKSRCLIFLKTMPCKKNFRRKMQGGKSASCSLKRSENCTVYLGESKEWKKKKKQTTDISNHTEQIFQGSEMLWSSLAELFNSLKDTFKHFVIGKSKCQKNHEIGLKINTFLWEKGSSFICCFISTVFSTHSPLVMLSNLSLQTRKTEIAFSCTSEEKFSRKPSIPRAGALWKPSNRQRPLLSTLAMVLN